MKDEKKTAPVLRFNGFSDAWELRKLSNIADRFDNLRVPITASDRIAGDTPYYGANGIQDYVDGFTHDGEFILVAEDGANNLKNYPVQYVNGKVWVNNHAHVLQGKNTITDNKFLMNSIKNFNIEPFLVGGGRAKLNSDVMMKLKFLLPSFKEQQKIGTFFKQLDNTITLHQRKLDKLKLLKQGYLQQLFPQNDEKVPRVRFANFKNKWEQRKLGSLATIVRGASPRPIQDPKWFDNESDIGWLRITDVTEQDGKIYHLEQHISKLGQAKTRVLIEPHLLLSIAATVGKPVVNYVKTGVHDGFLIFLSPTFEREFMFQWLEMFRPKWQKYGQPGSQVNLNSELVRNQEIVLPNHKEQQKIGAFLKQIDKAIILHKSKLDKLISLKKVLLQKMFI